MAMALDRSTRPDLELIDDVLDHFAKGERER
jgi:hypothetical protein